MCKFILSIVFLLPLASIGYSQDREKLNLSIGIGHNESSNLGVGYQLNQMQFGLGFGTKFGQKEEQIDLKFLPGNSFIILPAGQN
jgi:hypothetical protein